MTGTAPTKTADADKLRCQICAADELQFVISLGHQPPSDEFLPPHKRYEPFTAYPLDLYYCPQCSLVQLGYAVDPDVLFRDYVYNTASSGELTRHFAVLAKQIIEQYRLTAADLVVDIGCNDGTLLAGFQSHCRVLGIDPSSVAQMAVKKNIPVINDMFNETTAGQATRAHQPAKVILATNVFAHVRELDSFMRGIDKLLAADGVFISESHHLLPLVEKMQYDAIYHEHLRCYSVKPIQHLFKRFGLEVIDVELVTTHGGSIKVTGARQGKYPVQASVQPVIDQEQAAGLYRGETFVRFAERVTRAKHRLLELLLALRRDNHDIVGLGAPAKGNTLLNFCQIRPDLVRYLAEHSPLKIGKLAPGSLIEVVDEARLFAEQPAYALLLAWNLKDLIIPKLRQRGYRGKFIVPGETPEIVD